MIVSVDLPRFHCGPPPSEACPSGVGPDSAYFLGYQRLFDQTLGEGRQGPGAPVRQLTEPSGRHLGRNAPTFSPGGSRAVDSLR